MKPTVIVGLIIGLILTAFTFSILLAYPVKWLWNSTLPELFAFKVIDVWMAWKISFLSALLFKGNSVNTDN